MRPGYHVQGGCEIHQDDVGVKCVRVSNACEKYSRWNVGRQAECRVVILSDYEHFFCSQMRPNFAISLVIWDKSASFCWYSSSDLSR